MNKHDRKCPDPNCRCFLEFCGRLGSPYYRCHKCKKRWNIDRTPLTAPLKGGRILK